MPRRADALLPLTHDHHHALVQVRQLRLAGEGSDEDRLRAGSEFIRFFYGETIKHFHEEEEVVLPLIVDAVDLRPVIERVVWEHVQIHGLVRGLQRETEAEVVSKERVLTLAGTLEEHIRFEEKVVFPLVEREVPGALGELHLEPRVRIRR
jgi:hemerythrin-like domain-containing protein